MCSTTDEVVRDEQVREAAVALEVLQQVDDLRLDGHVERRHRLVADDEARLDGERARDADALSLAAGELVRIARDVLGVEADLRRAAGRTRASASAPSAMPVDRESLADDRADGHARIERARTDPGR